MTRTARGREIDMASLIAASDPGTSVVGNINATLDGNVEVSNTQVIPANEIEQAVAQDVIDNKNEKISTITDLQEKITKPVVVAEREFDRNGKKFIELEYSDGSIEEKEVK